MFYINTDRALTKVNKYVHQYHTHWKLQSCKQVFEIDILYTKYKVQGFSEKTFGKITDVFYFFYDDDLFVLLFLRQKLLFTQEYKERAKSFTCGIFFLVQLSHYFLYRK